MHKVEKFSDYLSQIEVMPQVNNGEPFSIDGENISPLCCSLMGHMMQDMPFPEESIPSVIFIEEEQPDTHPAFKRTGYYDFKDNCINIFVTGRALKDILRSIAHELIHADQHINKGLDLSPAVTGLGEDSTKAAEEIEADAYLRGNLGLRKWEDRLKPKFR